MRGRCPCALPRVISLVLGAGLLASSTLVFAQEQASPAPSRPSDETEAADDPPAPKRPSSSEMDAPDPPAPPTPPSETSDLLVPTPSEWKQKYDEARAKLLTGEFADAAVRFAELESTAVNRVDRALAKAQRTLADDWTSRNLVFVRRNDLADPAVTSRALNRRSTDELVSLYTNSVLYGIGSAIWLGTLTDPKTPAAAIVPGFALTAGSVGAVIALDSGRGLHYGVPQAIVSGMWVGFEHGLLWTFWHNSRAGRPDLETKTHATILWGLSSIGAVTGGILGETLGTTPGRSAWVGSTALWTGAIAGFATGALVEDGGTEALAVGGIGLTVGTGLGLLSASTVSPSIGRTRLIDLSGLLGGVGAAALYAAGSRNGPDGQATSGITAVGIASGLAIGWVATSGMDKDVPRTKEPNQDDSSPRPDTSKQAASGAAAYTSRGNVVESIAAHTRPLLMPQPSGAIIGAGGTF